jgi:hypothetical protein
MIGDGKQLKIWDLDSLRLQYTVGSFDYAPTQEASLTRTAQSAP